MKYYDTKIELVEIIKEMFNRNWGKMDIQLLKKDKYFHAELVNEGIIVSNLANEPLLEWKIFREIEKLFDEEGMSVDKGDAMNYKLGEAKLSLNSIEGRIAFNKGCIQVAEMTCQLWKGLLKLFLIKRIHRNRDLHVFAQG